MQEGLRLLPGFKPDILLVDIVLPDDDGFEFIKKIRSSADKTVRRLPAIALTAMTTDEFRERALAEGFQVFMSKPAPATEIVSAITDLVHRAGGQLKAA